MSAELINGKELSSILKNKMKNEIDQIVSISKRKPKLVVIRVGEDPASISYVNGKKKACEEIGIESEVVVLPENTTEYDLMTKIDFYNHDYSTDGILVQLPLPKHINEDNIVNFINPSKDVDCFHPMNIGKMFTDKESNIMYPCTPAGIIELLKYVNADIENSHTVIVGRSNIVGKPLANMLLSKNINGTVTVCHSRTKNLKDITKTADILIVAVGKPSVVTGDMVKPGAIVIDVGVNRIKDDTKKSGFRLVGDCDFKLCSSIASKITPVPGGVGPMTIAMLLKNTLTAYKNR